MAVGLSVGSPVDASESHANPETPAPGDPARDRVTVDAGPPSLPSDGAFEIRADVRVDEPTPYLEVRLQIHRPSGQLLFQRTEVRSDVATGTVTAEFTRELADLSLAPAAYPYEIRVRTEVGEPREQVVDGLLLVHAPEPAVTPLAIVLRVAEVPAFDPAGNFAVDPATSTETLDQVALAAGAVIDDPRLNLTLGIPGMTLDAWSRVAAGYTLAGPAGLSEIDAAEDIPRAYSETLGLISSAIATGRLELLDIPYADPDIGALAESHSLLDLGVHYAHSRATYLTTLEIPPSAGTAVVGDALPPGALEVLKERDISWALLEPESLTVDETTPTAGVWSIEGTRVRALVFDRKLTEALPTADAPASLLHVFEHSASAEATTPLVASLEIGPGRERVVEHVLAFTALADTTPWVGTVTASTASQTPPRGTTTAPATVESSVQPPAGYPAEVAEGRRYAVALEAAAGVEDEDARKVTEASLLAQSARWAGPDGRWSQIDRGRAFASSAVREASGVLDGVLLTAKDVTLSGQSGELPLSIVNDSAKDLKVKLVLRTQDIHLPEGETQTLTLRPQETLHTVSVDLRSSLSGRIEMELWAGAVLLDSATTTVRASYLDRLAVIGGVALLLFALLLYIRKRVRAADAGSMPSGE